MNTLLPALILYVNNPDNHYRDNSIRGIRDLLLNYAGNDMLDALFAVLDDKDQAKIQYGLFKTSPVAKNFTSNLANRLDIFVDEGITRVCSEDNIDFIEEFAKEKKTILYILTEQTYGFISALILNIATTTIQQYVDNHSDIYPYHVLPHSLFFIFEEFLNIGYVPNMTRNLQLLRKYQIYFILICQSMPSFRSIYGTDDSAAIMENCWYKLFFGAGGIETAKVFSELSGVTTVRSSSVNRDNPIIRNAEGTRETGSQRNLFYPDELLTMPLEKYILYINHAHPLELYKPYYRDMIGEPEIFPHTSYVPQAPITKNEVTVFEPEPELKSEQEPKSKPVTMQQTDNTAASPKAQISSPKSKEPKKKFKKEPDNFTDNLLNHDKATINRPFINKDEVANDSVFGGLTFISGANKGKKAYGVRYDISDDIIVNGTVPDNVYMLAHQRIQFSMLENCLLWKEGYYLAGWQAVNMDTGKITQALLSDGKTFITVPKADIKVQPIFKPYNKSKGTENIEEPLNDNDESNSVNQPSDDTKVITNNNNQITSTNSSDLAGLL